MKGRYPNMRGKSKFTLLFLLICLLLAAMLPLQAQASEGEDMAEWTVMFYLCGTDLESNSAMATFNLKAIAKTRPVPEVNMIVETGGAREWHAQELGMDVDPTKLERWSYTDQGFEKVGEAELASMGEQSTLQDFLVWTQENYPAKKYQLILWDHGGASISGVVFDELHQFSSLQLFDIAGALANSGIHLETFMTDTCLMATLETVEAVAPYANYFVGCEESLPGYGCNYASFIQYLYDDPACDGAMLGKRICSSTQEMYSDYNNASDLGTLTISLIDLSRVEPIRKAFDDYILQVEALLDDPGAFFDYCYATRNRETYAYPEFVDLYDLAELASGHGVSSKTAAALQNAVEDAVLYNVRGSSHIRSHGLTEFYAFNYNQYQLDHFSRVCHDPIYLAFLDRLSFKWKAPEWVYEAVERKPDVQMNDYSVDLSVRVSEDGKSVSLEMPADDSFITEGAWELLSYDPDLDLWRYYGRDPFVEEQNDGTTLTWQSVFDGTWPSLGGVPLTMTLREEQETYVLFTAPMNVNGNKDNLRIVYWKNEEDEASGYELIGSSQLDNHTGFPDRDVAPVAYGSSVEPLATLADLSQNIFLNHKTTEPFEYTPDTEVTKEALPAGQYAVRFIVTDVFGNKSQTEIVNCLWDGKTVVYEQQEAQ